MGEDEPMSEPSGGGPRPEDRPVDPDAVRRLEQLPDLPQPTTARAGSRPTSSPAFARPAPGRNNLVTTAGIALVLVGAFVAVASVLVVAPSDGMELVGIDLTGGAAATAFLVLAGTYAITGVLIVLRRPMGRGLGFVVGALALLIGLAQLPSAGVNGIPTVGVAVFVLYALAIGGNDFRRG
jgi:hypothetical protein